MNFFNRSKNLKDADDSELLASYRETGDLSVLGRLFEKQMPLVYGVCLKYLRDEELAKDAVMGIFEELVDKAKQHDIKQFAGWLYMVSRNYCLMQLRADKKVDVISLESVMEFTPFLHHTDENREAVMTALEICMEKLPQNQRRSIDLFFLKEKCYKEIADVLGFSLNEVKSYIQNGKRNLKICMEKSNG
ncbi:MAG TPA: sigma-70 family RNA polymerase sigma factor [Mucilaginibacter sp.]|jgi:RNA polymerase sigma-70 factor (ECF subfamily)|nr:sigma-70 family RNA polymerase sigma factor [Mucilaginibacter sp.]